MATCTVSGTLVDNSGSPVTGVTVRFRVIRPLFDALNQMVVPQETTTQSAANGSWSLVLDQGISGIFTFDLLINSISPAVRFPYSAIIPSSTSANFSTVVSMET